MENIKDYFFTSESVSEGHPDKIADQISDAILDEIIKKDKNARVACETLVKTGMALVAGEISTKAWVNIEKIVRKVIIDIGYDCSNKGFDGNSCSVITAIGEQSNEISEGVDKNNFEENKNQGAGDQGIMFGYACNETNAFMPAPIYYAHRLMERHSYLRKVKNHNFLRPDAKSQVTFKYENDKPKYIDTVIISSQHSEEISLDFLREFIKENIILKVLPLKYITNETKFIINPAGKFTIGGPKGDCGLTGRKIIVDTYGGSAHHGGGAFSGKDPSKVDRSAAYMGRYVTKNIVASGLAEKCEIQVSYAIGEKEPTSIMINTFSTNKISNNKIIEIIKKEFDLTPYGIQKTLNLIRPIYRKTASYGHFGRDDKDFTWEKLDKVEALKSYLV